MNQTALLYDPIVETREVLESYRVHGVLVAGWRATLKDASEQLIEFGTAAADQDLVSLGEGVRSLVEGGIAEQDDRARALAGQVADRLDQLNKSELPESEADWAF